MKENHHGTHEDIKVQTIDYCDANDQDRREGFWIFDFSTFEANDLNSERAQRYLYIIVQIGLYNDM